MKLLVNLALLIALLFVVFTETGQDLALDLFMRAHGQLSDYLADLLQN